MQPFIRQTTLPELGLQGQQALENSHVCIIGAGGLGYPVASYLAAAGVGAISIYDPDIVELSNLHRQLWFTTHDIGKSKADTAKNALLATGTICKVTAYDQAADKTLNAAPFTLIADCSDNFDTRLAINDVAFLSRTPLVWGAVAGWKGQVGSHPMDTKTPCFRCFCPKAPPEDHVPNCAQTGVLGPAVGIIANMQALEIIRQLTHIAPNFTGKIWQMDMKSNLSRLSELQKDPACFCNE